MMFFVLNIIIFILFFSIDLLYNTILSKRNTILLKGTYNIDYALKTIMEVMYMKKIVSTILLIAMIMSLASCGKSKEIKELEDLTKALSKIGTEEGTDALNELADSLEDNYSDDDYSDDDSDDDSDDYSDDDDNISDDDNFDASLSPGMELSGFYAFYDNAISRFEGPINKWETDDFFMFDAAMDYFFPSIHFVSMGLYDTLEFFGTDNGEYKEVDGNIVKFGKEYTRDEDGFSPNDKKGDIVGEIGILDSSAKTLSFETYIKRDGELISRVISEVVALSDGKFIVQSLSKTPLNDDRYEDTGNAYFMVFDSDRLEIIKAKFSPDVNFTYNSIIGKGNTTVEDMSQDYTLDRKSVV